MRKSTGFGPKIRKGRSEAHEQGELKAVPLEKVLEKYAR